MNLSAVNGEEGVFAELDKVKVNKAGDIRRSSRGRCANDFVTLRRQC
jgi:hypothetical protein